MNVKLRRLLMPLLRHDAAGKPPTFRTRSAARQAIYLIEKPVSLKSKAAKVRQRSEKQSSRASHNQETAKIYRDVEARAAGRCECGCGIAFSFPPSQWPELDHFYGRGKEPQTVQNTWRLLSSHHRAKTENNPSRAHWDRLFAAHCAKYGYEFKGRLIHAEPAKAGGAP